MRRLYSVYPSCVFLKNWFSFILPFWFCLFGVGGDPIHINIKQVAPCRQRKFSDIRLRWGNYFILMSAELKSQQISLPWLQSQVEMSVCKKIMKRKFCFTVQDFYVYPYYPFFVLLHKYNLLPPSQMKIKWKQNEELVCDKLVS